MFIFIVVVHIITSLLLITVILMQSGRAGGLTESLAGAESIFGTKTSSFMVRATSILAVVFLFTCIGLAILSTQRNRSLIANELIAGQKQARTATLPIKTIEPGNIETQDVKPVASITQKDIVPEKSTSQKK